MRIALGFANDARLAHSNLGFRIVEAALAARDDVRLERFFLPAEGLPGLAAGLRTSPSGLRLSACDLVLLSLSFEGDAPHLPALLVAGGLPARAAERRPGHPLVVGGGAALMINPEPLATFFDAILIGEAEGLLAAFLERWQAERGASRAACLKALAELPGAVVPLARRHRVWKVGEGRLRDGGSCSLRPEAGWAAELPEGEADAPVVSVRAPASAPVVSARLPAGTHFQEDLLLELARGCGRRCRFCVATRIYAPLRPRTLPALLERAEHGSCAGERVGLLALSAGDYPDLEALTATLRRLGRRLAISSLPATFARRAVAAELVASGATTLTIAPETGREELRARVGKPMRDAAILDTVRMLGEVGVRRLRTYFLIGLPFEEDADLRAIPRLLAAMRGALPGRVALGATVNPFVPKPRTPFQWAPFAGEAYLRDAARRLRRELPSGVRLRVKSAREASWHAVLARGDATWGERLARWALGGESPARQLRADGERLADWTGSIEPGTPLPWVYLSPGGEQAELAEGWQAAQRAAPH